MKQFSLLLFASLAFVYVHGQKLSSVQQHSLRAPADVKIDGKATDWGNKFEARNPTTELFYTIANDDNKLYLVAQTDKPDVYNRICNGGIKFVVQKNGRKSDEGAAFVKYPLFREWGKLGFDFNMPRYILSFEGGIVQRDNLRMTKVPEKKVTTTEQADSIMKSHNKKLGEYLKYIYTDGIPGVDNIVPLYNDQGIEAAVAFDNNKVFTCEMAIDLKLLGLAAQSGQKFAYHVVINGEPYKASSTPPPGSTSVNPHEATTDFWGEYTLAK